MKKLFLTCTLSIFITAITTGQVNTEKYRKDYDKKGFVFSNNFAFGLTGGNTEYLSISEFLRVDYNGDKNDYFLVGKYNSKSSQSEHIIYAGFMHLRAIREVTERVSIEAFVQKEFNEFISLNDRNLAGTGARIRILNYLSEKDSVTSFKMYFGTGVMGENELYDTDPENTNINLVRSTNYLTMSFDIPAKFGLSGVTYFQPALSDFNNFRIVSEIGLDILLTKRISFTLDFSLRYDNEPVTKVKKYDYAINNGFRFTLP